ncbi:copper chaperone CopZ [Scopulibacillus darangshiensis]|uniref:Copper chaperone CopZ n=1 Tax=Scopulibacillus darangshiensis TaxID=442528 RepID=A0A4R2NU07_9BACL|nr:heavy metal-associated domain-containing protein [Scopulibacillus darangshiensis]TCP24865.1 copper chaperone CopZ [Scopulibacillus darangshiensis]
MSKKSLMIGMLCASLLGLGVFFGLEHSHNTQATSDETVFTGVNLSCSGCEEKMENALSKIIGIKDYKMNPEKKTVTVVFNHRIMQPEWIEQSLKAAGFDPK